MDGGGRVRDFRHVRAQLQLRARAPRACRAEGSGDRRRHLRPGRIRISHRARRSWKGNDDCGRRRPARVNPMLLALDVGNTNITIGAFDGAKLTGRWRLRTIREQTPDEWGILMRNLFSLSDLELKAVDGVVISSVVPAVDQPLTAMDARYFGREPMFIGPTTDLCITVRHDNPVDMGADRLVDIVADL